MQMSLPGFSKARALLLTILALGSASTALAQGVLIRPGPKTIVGEVADTSGMLLEGTEISVKSTRSWANTGSIFLACCKKRLTEI